MSKSVLRLRLTRGRRLGSSVHCPGLRPRVKRIVQNDLDVLSRPRVALSNLYPVWKCRYRVPTTSCQKTPSNPPFARSHLSGHFAVQESFVSPGFAGLLDTGRLPTGFLYMGFLDMGFAF